MATKTRQVLQNGTTANDGTGDTLRDAANKINTNFTYVWNRLGGKDSYFTDNLTADSDGNLIFTNGVYTNTFGTSTLSGNRDIDLPNASGTVVLKTTTDVLTNKTLTTPVISTVHDSNGNTVLNLDGVSSSVNYVNITNGDSVTPPVIKIDGDSADVNLHIQAKNNGHIKFQSPVVLNTQTITTNGAVSTTIVTTFCNKSSALSLTLANGSNLGDQKTFVNINTGNATITPATFASGTSITVAQGHAVSLVWHTTGWVAVGISSGITLTP
jgi:hypothetical protein